MKTTITLSDAQAMRYYLEDESCRVIACECGMNADLPYRIQAVCKRGQVGYTITGTLKEQKS